MLPGTSTIRSKLAICVAATALLAGLAITPAAADSSHRLLRSEADSSMNRGTVGQAPRQVNHRGDRANERTRRPVYPAQPGKPGRNGRDQAGDGGGDRHDRGDRGGRDYRKPPRHADGDRRHDRRRYERRRGGHGGHNQYGFKPRQPSYRQHDRYRPKYRRSPWRYRHSYVRPRHYPIVVVPYHVHPYPIVGYHPHGQSAASCGTVPAQRHAYTGGSHQGGSTVVGGVIGAVVGSQIGKGNGRLAAVGVGTLLGALIGNDIGRSMDAVDQGYTTGSMGHALETAPSCNTITWENPQSGNYGSITPTTTYEESPGRYCREFQQQIVVGGQVQDGYGTACRQPDGNWEIVAGQS